MSIKGKNKSKYENHFIFAMILSFGLVILSFVFYSKFSDIGDSNNVYYVFSTSAQTLAALVGFVLTVYIFNHQNLRATLENDDSLTGIIEKEIERYYKIVFYLSVYTALTLILDLLMLQLNKIEGWAYKPEIYTMVGILNVVGIIGAFFTALYILRPSSLEERARSILGEEAENADHAGRNRISRGDFIDEFIELEKLIVKYTDERFSLENMPKHQRRMSLSRRIELLYTSEKVNREVLERLFSINKYRNLVVHGHIEKVDENQYIELKQLLDIVRKEIPS